MEYRNMGFTGLKVSALSYGSWMNFGGPMDFDAVKGAMKAAVDAGVNLFDCAESYAAGRAEELLGRAIDELELPRNPFCVSTKAMFGSIERPLPTQKGLSRKHLREACDGGLLDSDGDGAAFRGPQVWKGPHPLFIAPAEIEAPGMPTRRDRPRGGSEALGGP